MTRDRLPDEPTAPPAVNDEFASMRKLVNAVEGLDPASRGRVLRWLYDRYQHEIGDTT